MARAGRARHRARQGPSALLHTATHRTFPAPVPRPARRAETIPKWMKPSPSSLPACLHCSLCFQFHGSSNQGSSHPVPHFALGALTNLFFQKGEHEPPFVTSVSPASPPILAGVCAAHCPASSPNAAHCTSLPFLLGPHWTQDYFSHQIMPMLNTSICSWTF